MILPADRATGRYLNMQTGELRHVVHVPAEPMWTAEDGHVIRPERWVIFTVELGGISVGDDMDQGEWTNLITLPEAARILRELVDIYQGLKQLLPPESV